MLAWVPLLLGAMLLMICGSLALGFFYYPEWWVKLAAHLIQWPQRYISWAIDRIATQVSLETYSIFFGLVDASASPSATTESPFAASSPTQMVTHTQTNSNTPWLAVIVGVALGKYY